jgi:ABC-2 type transport system permease protein
MIRYLQLYYLFVIQRLKILMEYRLNFFLGASCTIFEQSAGLLAMWVVLQQVPNLNGWRFDELLLVYGLLAMAKSITYMFADNLWTVGEQYIRTGGFDRFLVRPINPLFHLLADRFDHQGIGHFAIGAFLVVKAMAGLAIPWTPINALYLAVAVISGGVIFIALNLITCVSAFWIMDSVPVTRAIFEMHEFAKYPLTIYHPRIGDLLTWLIPYGFASFYPASYLLGRDTGVLVWLAPVVAGGLLFVGYRLWLVGLRHYAGSGT